MYKIVGADGKEYGPISLQQLQKWIQESRINAQTRVQLVGAADWKTVAEVPELSSFLYNIPAAAPITLSAPSPFPAAPSGPREQGLAPFGLFLGFVALFCRGTLAGAPAIICGHIARNRAQTSPE